MRIYDRDGFMSLPAGTIFCKGKPWFFEEFSVKGDTLNDTQGSPIDWTYLGLQWIESESSEDADRKLEDMKSNGASYPMQESYGRDGCFDSKDIFLVYEQADLQKIKEMI